MVHMCFAYISFPPLQQLCDNKYDIFPRVNKNEHP